MPTLPHATALTIGRFDEALDDSAAVCDLSALAFVDAYGLVGTACAIQAARASGAAIEVVPPNGETTGAHLTAMGFREFVASEGRPLTLPDAPAAEASSVVVPLQRASDAGGSQSLSHLLWAQLRDHVDPQVLQAVVGGVWEIVGNAREHSGADALIMGQVYRRPHGDTKRRPVDHDNRVQVVIGDVGRGIRGSFLAGGVINPASDREAIDLALEYLVSSVDDPGRGQGLTDTMEQVVGLQGRMIVRSGNAKVAITARGRTHTEVPQLPGVIVALSLPLYPG
jgi:hypothetical protein